MEAFTRISREVLLSSKGKINVDLYFQRKNPNGSHEHILFAKAGLGFLTFKKIADNPVGALYVKKSDLEKYTEMIEKSMGVIVNDPNLSLPEKSQAMYACAREVVEDVFTDPRSPENIHRSGDTVEHMVKFALSEPGAIKSLLSLSEKDYYTFSHCIHVSVFSLGLAKVFGIKDSTELHQLGLGTLLHDAGKTRIDKNVLNKPGKLTPEEFEEIKKHPRLGFEMLQSSLPAASLDIILHHHEKFNGQGYPDQLAKENISLFAKIASLADVYDALTTNRVYAKARHPFEAIMTMKNEMIGHFEEDKFLSFIRMLGPGMNV
jgi:HD-GYP domain-containing protein (c-di-GMP phosphodiesterase class II)